MARKFPFVARLFKGWTMRPWYLSDSEDEDDTSGSDEGSGDETGGDDSGSTGGDTGDEDDETTKTVTVDGVTYSFSSVYDTEVEAEAVAALTEAIESEDEETVDAFEEIAEEDDDTVLGEYLGCYEVTAETGTLTLASPVEVTDPEVYSAIVLHYNTETGEWEQVDDVQIIDGYVYAVFTSLSPVAVYTIKKKYVATVTIGEEVSQYETIAEAVSAAMTAVEASTNPTIALTWNKVVTETIGPLYNINDSDNPVTLDLGGYTLYGESIDGYVVSVVGTGSTVKLNITNGTIIADENTTGAVYAENNYVALEGVTMIGSKPGCAVLDQVDTKTYPTGCTITSTNGICIQLEGDSTAGTCVSYSNTITQIQEDETEGNAAVVILNSAKIHTMNVNADTVITSDVCALKNMSATGKLYIGGDCEITAPVAAYVPETCATDTGFYTTTNANIVVNGTIDANGTNASKGVALKTGTYSVKPEDCFIANAYEVVANDDGTYSVVAGEYVEITKSDGTSTVTNILSSTSLYSGCTVKLLHDITASGLGVNYACTIDLNGYTYTVTSSSGVYANKDIEFTIKNGKLINTNTSTGGTAIGALRGTVHIVDMEIVNECGHGVTVGNASKDYDATCDISGDTTITAGASGVFVQNLSTNTVVPSVTIEDGVTVTAGDYAISGNGSYDNTEITINGGTFSSTGDGAAVYHPQAGTLTINGGTFNGVVAGIQICDGTTTINDATVNVTGSEDYLNKTGDGSIPDAAALSVINRSGYSSTYPTLTVNGGTFKSTNGKALKAYAWASDTMSDWDATGYIKVSGGNFSDVVDSAYIEEGYECNAEATDGLYTVSASA